MLRHRPCESDRIGCGRFLAWTKIRPQKTASHIPASNVRGIFGEADAALLTQGKDNEAKITEQGRRNAARVRLPLPQAG